MKTLLLLRHAEREEILEGEVGNESLLTQQGKQDCLDFSLLLKEKVVSIKSSPIQRCQQTAELIAKSTGYPIDNINTSSLLGDPGFIIKNGEVAWLHWQQKGHEVVNQHLLNGIDHWEGFSELNRAVARVSDIIHYELQQAEQGTHIWVTHDTILAAYASRVLPKHLTLEQWPGFLSCLKIQLLDNGTLDFSYQETRVHL